MTLNWNPSTASPATLLRVSVGVAVATIVLKTLAWWVSGSVALLSDAMESFVNLAGAMFALTMVTVARAPADAEHPYGHHKAEYFSSGFEGILIIGASLGIAYAAVMRWIHPEPLQALDWGIAFSVVSSTLNGLLAWAMLKSSRAHRSKALEGDARHLITDVYTSAGVIIGLGLVMVTDWLWLDPLAALLVAANILREGWRLVWESAQGLMDEAADDHTQERVNEVLSRFSQQQDEDGSALLEFDHLRTRQAGHRCYVDLHMHVPGAWSMDRAAQERTDVEAALMAAVPGLHATIQLLPKGVEALGIDDHQVVG